MQRDGDGDTLQVGEEEEDEEEEKEERGLGPTLHNDIRTGLTLLIFCKLMAHRPLRPPPFWGRGRENDGGGKVEGEVGATKL